MASTQSQDTIQDNTSQAAYDDSSNPDLTGSQGTSNKGDVGGSEQFQQPVEQSLPPVQHSAFTIDQDLQTPDYGANIMSARTPPQSRSRQNSAVFPLFHSSLPYALVRDFAYPPFNPLHYGPLDYSPSGRSTPALGGDYYSSARRLSDPPQPGNDRGIGPWGDSSYDRSSHAASQQLPSTSFAYGIGLPASEQDSEEDSSSRRYSKHRKSKSYASMDDFGCGRQRSSGDGYQRISRSGHAYEQGEDSTWRRGSSLSRQVHQDDDRTPLAHGQNLSLRSLGDSSDPSQHPPFREDGDTVPYSPVNQDEHRPESASLDESFAGPSLALYDFMPEHSNELALREGQIIQVGYRHGLGWLVAMDPETGEQGLVPEAYVRLLRDIEGWAEEEQDQDQDPDHTRQDGSRQDYDGEVTTTVADDLAEVNQRAAVAAEEDKGQGQGPRSAQSQHDSDKQAPARDSEEQEDTTASLDRHSARPDSTSLDRAGTAVAQS